MPTASDSSDLLLEMAGRVARFGGWYVDLADQSIRWSDQLNQILGYPPNAETGADAPGATVLSRYLPDDQARMSTLLTEYSGAAFDRRGAIPNAAGEILQVRVVGGPVYSDDGDLIGIQGAFFDDTKLMETERSKQRTESRFGSVFDTMSDGIMLLDHDWVITYMNPSGYRISQREPHDLIGQLIWDLAPDSLTSDYGVAYRTAIANNERVNLLTFFERVQAWLNVTAYPVQDGLAVYFRDVTEEQNALSALENNEKRLAAQASLLDATRDAVIVRDTDNLIEYWNTAAESTFGWTSAEALGKRMHELTGVLDIELFMRATDEVMSEGTWKGELAYTRRDGVPILVECTWTLLPQFLSDHPAILAVEIDVTERRRDEQRQRRADRLESIGTLASGIAHDLNNVLTPILMSVQLLSRGETDPHRQRLLATMESGVRRGSDMVRQVTSFAQGEEGERVRVDSASMLGELEEFCIQSLGESVVVRFDIAERLWDMVGDSTQILQVLLNLVSNARDAMPDGGELTVRARNAESADVSWSLNEIATPGRYLRIDVEDTGTGIPPHVVPKIFDPFFTTKATGAGTGLGLATSMGIIRAHGGHIQVYSEIGRGSRFEVRVPAAAPATRESLAERAAASGTLSAGRSESITPGHGQLILIVDDEFAIRSVVQHALEEAGYDTIVATNGSEAVDVVESSDRAIDLILTDIRMPVMDGASAARYFQAHHPTIPIIAASGLAVNEMIARGASDSVRHFLAKPFTTGDLLDSVQDVLSDRAPWQTTRSEQPTLRDLRTPPRSPRVNGASE